MAPSRSGVAFCCLIANCHRSNSYQSVRENVAAVTLQTDSEGYAEGYAGDSDSRSGIPVSTVFLSIIQILTLVFIAGQAFATGRSAKAASENVAAVREQVKLLDSQIGAAKKETILLNRAYLTVNEWVQDSSGKRMVLKFRIYNPSKTAARIEEIEFVVDGVSSRTSCGRMLTPREGYWVPILLVESSAGG
ncbi:MAG: hypothetical protein WB869_00180 [Candidatus Acidiferrales bacterium]